MIYKLMVEENILRPIFQVIPIVSLFAAIYIAVRVIRIRTQKTSIIVRQEIFRLLFFSYCIGIAAVLLVPNNFWTAFWFYIYNGYPGSTIGPLFQPIFDFVPTIVLYLIGQVNIGRETWFNIIGNIILFIPYGVFISKKVGRKKLAIFLFTIIGIEIWQPIVGRSFDVDDIICGIIGCYIGVVLFKLINDFLGKKNKCNEKT